MHFISSALPEFILFQFLLVSKPPIRSSFTVNSSSIPASHPHSLSSPLSNCVFQSVLSRERTRSGNVSVGGSREPLHETRGVQCTDFRRMLPTKKEEPLGRGPCRSSITLRLTSERVYSRGRGPGRADFCSLPRHGLLNLHFICFRSGCSLFWHAHTTTASPVATGRVPGISHEIAAGFFRNRITACDACLA